MDKTSVKLINGFVSQLSDVDFIYLRTHVQIVEAIKDLLRDHNVTKKEFCEAVGIKPSVYQKFISGNYLYNVSDAVSIKHYRINLDTKAAREKDAITFTYHGKKN